MEASLTGLCKHFSRVPGFAAPRGRRGGGPRLTGSAGTAGACVMARDLEGDVWSFGTYVPEVRGAASGGSGPGQLPPVWTWKAARRTALARAGSGCAAARATRTWTVRG